VDVPVAAYNVSGEYAMVEAAAAQGWINREPAIREVLTSIRRAGADLVLTYWALEYATALRQAQGTFRPLPEPVEGGPGPLPEPVEGGPETLPEPVEGQRR
jgi:hypothetical protein